MDLIQTAILKGHQAEKIGDLNEALEAFNQAFNLLIDQASQFALEQIGPLEDKEELRKFSSVLLQYSRDYLSRDLLASTILNEMGILFEAMEELINAKQKFSEAMEYIPQGLSYDEPKDNLARLEQIEMRFVEIPDED